MFQIKDAKIIISNNNVDRELGFQKKKGQALPEALHHVSSLMFLLFFCRHHCRCPLYPQGVHGLCRHLSSCPVPPPAWSWPFSSPHAFPEASTTHNTCSAPKTLDLPARPRYLTLSVQSPSTAEPGSQLSFQVWRSFSQAQSSPSGWTTPSITTIRAPQS